MKFPRNARIFRGQLDAAPFVSVFFLLVIFVMLRSQHYIPGVRVELPSSGNLLLPRTDRPTVSLAVTTNAIYFDNEKILEGDLSNRLSAAAHNFSQSLILVVQVDKNVTEEQFARLEVIAGNVGITNLLKARLPGAFESPDTSSHQP